MAMGENVNLLEQKLLSSTSEFKVDVHHWLILHGRYTCIARKPRCGSCMIDVNLKIRLKTRK
jgi:endonuclease-3